MIPFRIGHGYDVHRLVQGRSLIIGGVTIPYEKGLDGHSDADVLLHAITDAILGAAGLGDIGKLYPDTDNRFLGINSMILLKDTFEHIKKLGYHIGNIDATVIAQKPKLSPYIDTMRSNIAKALEIEKADVNVKATTEERLGFTGNGEGIASHAVVLLCRDR